MSDTIFYVDEKVTVWRRTWYRSDTELTNEQIIDSHQNSEFTHNNMYDSEILFETEELMTPEDNGGQSTTEFYIENGKLVWTNFPDESNSSEKIGRDFDDHDSSLLYGIDNN